jgi:hypothetical protein
MTVRPGAHSGLPCTNLEREFGPLMLVRHASNCGIARIQLRAARAQYTGVMRFFLDAAVSAAKNPFPRRTVAAHTAENASETYTAAMIFDTPDGFRIPHGIL